MKPSLHFPSFAMARIRQGLQWLKKNLSEWVPQPAPVLVPIPIPVERRLRPSDRRHSGRGD